MSSVIITGAGAAGLFASRRLSEKGYQVTLLEARERIGGRIYSVTDKNYDVITELGAEFIHGDLEITKNLLKEYGIDYHATGGEMWRFENGRIIQSDEIINDKYRELEEKLTSLENDISVYEFLQKYFGGDDCEKMRKEIIGFVEGYDAADITKASTFAFREEWLEMGESDQYRVKGGYSLLMDKLLEDCVKNGVILHLNTVVTEIHNEDNGVRVITSKGEIYSAEKIIVTVPLNVLKSGMPVFLPALNEKTEALNKLQSGGVIKFLFQFEDDFWNNAPLINSLEIKQGPAMFIFSDSSPRTWWTQSPVKSALLTGYLSGPSAEKLKNEKHEDLFLMAMKSLQSIFSGKAPSPIAWRIVNWLSDPFAKGAYSYQIVDDKTFRRKMAEPVDHKLFFAGEALSTGKSTGTVEAAFESAIECVRQITAS